MSKGFVDALEKTSSYKLTENGQVAMDSTGSNLVNLFGEIGALRTRTQNEICQMFSKAFGEDRLLATKMSFYARDIRQGGLGERETPRVIWKYLANTYPDIMRKNIHLVPFFGRWDDMYVFVKTPCEEEMWAVIRSQFKNDLENMMAEKPISIMAKWLKSTNVSSKASCALGVRTAKALGLTIPQYRKTISKMRKYLDVVEHKMSKNLWEFIEYSAVPSYAMKNYRKAFGKHDRDRFSKYLDSLQRGETKINSGTLYPYDIVRNYIRSYRNMRPFDVVLEEQWKALPNYIKDSTKSVLIMCDTSGSMYTNNNTPISTALALSIYFAERNKGEFHNKFLTFSTNPKLQSIIGESLQEKIFNLSQAKWAGSTNLAGAFQLVLDTAVANNMSSEDMPTSIVVISDMEINYCSNTTFYKAAKKHFAAYGYKIPQLVFWNVEARNDTFHADSKEEGVILVSGSSPATFRKVLETTVSNPYQFMLETLNDPVYDCVHI